MPRFMLDTDICSYIVKRSHDAVLKKLQATPIDQVCISVITKSELLYGVEISPRRQADEAAVNAFLRHIDVLDFPDEAAAHYADIRANLKRSGAMIGANDLLIAAHARALNMTLVTNNGREFGRVHGLTIENWAVEDKSSNKLGADLRKLTTRRKQTPSELLLRKGRDEQ